MEPGTHEPTQAEQNAQAFAKSQANLVSGAGLTPEEYANAKNAAYEQGLAASGYLSTQAGNVKAPTSLYSDNYISNKGDILKSFTLEIPSSVKAQAETKASPLQVSDNLGGAMPKTPPPVNPIIGYRSGVDEFGKRYSNPVYANDLNKPDVSDPFSSLPSSLDRQNSIALGNGLIDLSNQQIREKNNSIELGNAVIDLSNQQKAEKNNSIALGNGLIDLSNKQLQEKNNSIGLGNALIDLSNQQNLQKRQLIEQGNFQINVSNAISKLELKDTLTKGIAGGATQFDLYNAKGANIGTIPAKNALGSVDTILTLGEPVSIRASNPAQAEQARQQAKESRSSLLGAIGEAQDLGLGVNIFNAKGNLIKTVPGESAYHAAIGAELGQGPIMIGKAGPTSLPEAKEYVTKSFGIAEKNPNNAEIKLPFGITIPSTGTFPSEVVTGAISGGIAVGTSLAGFAASLPERYAKFLSHGPSPAGAPSPFDFGAISGQLTTPGVEKIIKPYEPETLSGDLLGLQKPKGSLPYLIGEGTTEAYLVGSAIKDVTGLGIQGVKALSKAAQAAKPAEALVETPKYTTNFVREFPTYRATNMMREKIPSDVFGLDTRLAEEPVAARQPTPRNTFLEDISKEVSVKLQTAQNKLLLPREKPIISEGLPPEETNPLGYRGKPPIQIFTPKETLQLSRANVVEQTTPRNYNEVFSPTGIKLPNTFGDLGKPLGALIKEEPAKTIEPVPPEITNPLGYRGKPPVKTKPGTEIGITEFRSDILNRQFTPEDFLTPSGQAGSPSVKPFSLTEKPTPFARPESAVKPLDLSEYYIRPGKIDTDRLLGIEQPAIGESKGRIADILKAAEKRSERENPKETTALTSIGTPEFDKFVPNSLSFGPAPEGIGLDLEGGTFTSTEISLGKGLGFVYRKGGNTPLGFDINKPTNPTDFFGPQKKKPSGEEPKGGGNQILLQLEPEVKAETTTITEPLGYREDNISLGTGNLFEIKKPKATAKEKEGLITVTTTKADQEMAKYLGETKKRGRVSFAQESEVISYPQGTKSELTGKQKGIQELKFDTDMLQGLKQKQTQASKSDLISRLTSEFDQTLAQTSKYKLTGMLETQGKQQGTLQDIISLQTTKPVQIEGFKQTQEQKPRLGDNLIFGKPQLTIPDLMPKPQIPTPQTPIPDITGGKGGFPIGGGFGIPPGTAGGKKRRSKRLGLSFNIYSVNPEIVGAIEQAGVVGLSVSRSPAIYQSIDKELKKAGRIGRGKGTKLAF